MDAAFLAHVRALEEKMFGDLLDPKDPMRMQSNKYSWLYRPSHHVESGLITEEDIELLKNGGTLLSLGAHPGYLEQVIVALGVPSKNIVTADSDAAILDTDVHPLHFSMHDEWPLETKFDRIIFPESLCIALSKKLEQEGWLQNKKDHSSDAREAELLGNILQQALDHLKPNGIIRANGPQSHPNIIKRVQEKISCEITYERFLMKVTP